MRATRQAILAVIAALALTGCVHTPTEDDAGGTMVHGTVSNVAGEATIVTFQCFLDGEKLTPEPATGPARAEADLIGAVLHQSRGFHRLEFRMLHQTESPSAYRFRSVTVDSVRFTGFTSGEVVARFTLPDRDVAVATGDSVFWDVNL